MHTIKLVTGADLDFVDWTDEPHHKLVFENPYTRILTAVVHPGESNLKFRFKPLEKFVSEKIVKPFQSGTV